MSPDMNPAIDPSLVRDVDLLCLDAGNTVIFLDHARLAELLGEVGFDTTAAALVRAEGEAKALAESGGLVDVPWSERERPGALAWGRMVATIAVRAGLDVARASDMLAVAWREHEVFNLWRKVPDGLGDALDAVRRSGVRVAIISNSEGMLEALFERLGIRRHFDLVVDSGIVGVEKPDPRIFQIAMDAFGVARSRTLHLGDIFATDIEGARRAGVRHALIDPFEHYRGRHLEVPRVVSVAAVAEAVLRDRAP